MKNSILGPAFHVTVSGRRIHCRMTMRGLLKYQAATGKDPMTIANDPKPLEAFAWLVWSLAINEPSLTIEEVRGSLQITDLISAARGLLGKSMGGKN